MSIHYAIRPANAAAHVFHVTCRVEQPDPAGQRFMLPAWVPGSYMIREFARHVVRITALGGGRKLDLEKLDKHTWRAAPTKGPVELAYEVYAWDQSVRAAHLDESHGFFNGTSVFLLPIGHEHEPCTVDILPPAGDGYGGWRVATGLAPARGTRRLGFGTYRADNYDELIDCPVEMGTFEFARFDVLGVPHEIAITGRVPRLDVARLTADIARMCEAHIRLFEPRSKSAPFKRFTFMVTAVGDGYGGLEHRNSTALLCKRDELPFIGMKDTTEGYRNFLGLASHEYFHAWNVKRIKPAEFVPYDLSQENYTSLLWAFEGFTSYYDDLMLVRSGLLSEKQYFETLAKALTSVMQRTGRLKQSVAESSFDAWIKYYRQDENAPNSVVSYYQKGALVGLALDLTLRAETGGRISLDDVMRALWRRARDDGSAYEGVGKDGIIEVTEKLSGVALGRRIRQWTEGTHDPDFTALLAPFGVQCASRPAVDSPHFALLGIKIASSGSDCKLTNVFDGSPAQRAGLSAGDVLIALDGLRVSRTNLDTLLTRYATGDLVECLAFRRDELMSFKVQLATQPPLKYVLAPDEHAGRLAQRLRAGWIAA
jgi:predicted metalloprotease with PDZ domain